MPVPFVDLRAQYAEIASEVAPQLADVLTTCSYIGGPHVQAFEEAYARLCGVRSCVGVGNGTDAVELALRVAGVTPGGEVIVPANTFIATAEAASRIGARVVLADVDEAQLLLDPDAVAEALTPRTQAIVAVHLFGQVAPMERLVPLAAAAGVALVEDAAQAHGARRHGHAAGGLADVAATSFYPGKNLGAAGDAGAVTTNNAAWAARLRRLRDHGSVVKYVHEEWGINSRLDAVQAVVLRAKLARLGGWNAARRAAADRYATLLADLPGVRTPVSAAGSSDVWHLYVIRVAERDRVAADLGEAGIGVGVHYPIPLHRTPAYEHLGLRAGRFPVAEHAATQILSLPMFPHLRADQQAEVADALRRTVAS